VRLGGQESSIIAQDGIGMFVHVEIQGFALSCTQGGSLHYLGSAQMLRCLLLLYIVLMICSRVTASA